MRGVASALGLLLVGLPAAAVAGPTRAQERARAFSAHPDAPSAAVFYRAQSHGKLGARLPLWAGAGGWSLHLPALIELHNGEGRFIPSQYWRGRLALELTLRRAASARLAVGHSLLLEHESDHVSGPPGGFVHENGVALRQDLTWSLGPHALTASWMPRFHLYSCTVAAHVCAPGRLTGNLAFEPIVELVWEGPPLRATAGKLRPFVALAGSWLLAHGEVMQTRRLVGELGLAWPTARRGIWQLFATSLAGHELGYLRAREVTQVGLGVRWALGPTERH